MDVAIYLVKMILIPWVVRLKNLNNSLSLLHLLSFEQLLEKTHVQFDGLNV